MLVLVILWVIILFMIAPLLTKHIFNQVGVYSGANNPCLAEHLHWSWFDVPLISCLRQFYLQVLCMEVLHHGH